jgi:hypothetical protein
LNLVIYHIYEYRPQTGGVFCLALSKLKGGKMNISASTKCFLFICDDIISQLLLEIPENDPLGYIEKKKKLYSKNEDWEKYDLWADVYLRVANTAVKKKKI